MSLYEGMFLIDNRQANRDWDGALATLTSLLTKHGAEILRTVKWGERRLAYEINGRRRATYVLIYFQADGEATNRIYRECELSELVHRALILKIAKLPPEEETRPFEERAADRSSRASRRAHDSKKHEKDAKDAEDANENDEDEDSADDAEADEPDVEDAAESGADESATGDAPADEGEPEPEEETIS